jgi:hypothetical protein
LASNAHPEIQFAVHQCARFTHCPRSSHADAIKRICRYLQGVLSDDQGLTFTPDCNNQLDCYVDADFAGLWKHEDDQDPVCVKSRTGYVMTLAGCPIHWVSKLQTEIALSTTESEYIALSQSFRDLIPMRRMLSEILVGMNLESSSSVVINSTVWEDNNGAISTARATHMSPRTKHIAIKYHFVRSHILSFDDSGSADGGIQLKKIESRVQKADIFTKGLPGPDFARIRLLLCGW